MGSNWAIFGIHLAEIAVFVWLVVPPMARYLQDRIGEFCYRIQAKRQQAIQRHSVTVEVD